MIELTSHSTAPHVVIVGSGPTLLGAGLGAKIDAVDIVIRFNRFETVGFEADVGTRTDIWFGYMEPHPQIGTFKQVLFPWVGEVNIQKKFDRIERACRKLNIPFEKVEDKIVSRAYNILGQTYPKVPKPRAGFVGLVWAMFQWPLKNISIVGFDCSGEQECYYRPALLSATTKNKHDIEQEKKVLNAWIKMGILKLLS